MTVGFVSEKIEKTFGVFISVLLSFVMNYVLGMSCIIYPYKLLIKNQERKSCFYIKEHLLVAELQCRFSKERQKWVYITDTATENIYKKNGSWIKNKLSMTSTPKMQVLLIF